MPIPASEVDRRVARFLGARKRSGLRMTHQRLWLFREVARSEEQPDAETVRPQLRRRLRDLSLDIVYRTLRVLEDPENLLDHSNGRRE